DADVDLRRDLGAFADHQHVVGEDLAGELAVDADGAFEGELAFEFTAAAQERVDFPFGAFRVRRDWHGGATLAHSSGLSPVGWIPPAAACPRDSKFGAPRDSRA